MITKTGNKKGGRGRAPATVRVSSVTEWTDSYGLLELFGLRRATTYHLVQTEPALKGAAISLKGEFEVRGKRLFHVPTFRKFLDGKREANRS
jgi:hypothetical protein